MSKLFRLSMIALMVSSVFLTSCKDEKEDGEKNSVTVGSETFGVKSGVVLNYGPDNVLGGEDTHYNSDFYLSDGTLTYGIASNASFVLYAELFSAGTEGFTAGTFEIMAYESLTEDDIDKNLFEYAMITFDSNEDGLIDSEVDETAYVTSGTITVSGTSPNYTIEFNVKLDNGKTLTSSYSGEFKVHDAQ